jgi:hypothetical protein
MEAPHVWFRKSPAGWGTLVVAIAFKWLLALSRLLRRHKRKDATGGRCREGGRAEARGDALQTLRAAPEEILLKVRDAWVLHGNDTKYAGVLASGKALARFGGCRGGGGGARPAPGQNRGNTVTPL